MAETPFDISKAHRWFAAEMNNRAWDLVESPERTPNETDEMISAAHAASIHWQMIGGPVNSLRAECLLATVYALTEYDQAAVHHANKCLMLGEQIGHELTAFDRASAHGCAANAYRAAGQLDRADEHYQKLAELTAALTDLGERELVVKLYPAPAKDTNT